MVIGGGRGYHGDTYFYDLNKEKWSKGPPLKKGRSGHAAGIVIDEITKAKIIHKFNTITCLSNLRYVLGFEAKLGNSS